MPLFRRLTDEEQIAKWDKEEKLMLKKYYDIREGQNSLPPKAYLLKPEKIFAASYEKINENHIRVNIGYESNYRGYVSPSVRMNYNRIIKGSLLCENIKSIKELAYSKKSSISVPMFSDHKIIVFPVQSSTAVKVKCKKIFIE